MVVPVVVAFLLKTKHATRVFWYLLNIRLTNFQKDRVVIHTRFSLF